MLSSHFRDLASQNSHSACVLFLDNPAEFSKPPVAVLVRHAQSNVAFAKVFCLRGSVFYLNSCRKTCKARQKQVCIPFRMKRPFPGVAPANISQRRRSGQYSKRCVHECTWVQVHLTLTQQLLSVLCSFYNYNTGHKQEVRTDDCISWSMIKRLTCSRSSYVPSI